MLSSQSHLVLVRIDFDSSCRVGELDVAEKKNLGSASFLDLEVFTAPVGEKEGRTYKESGKGKSAELVCMMCRLVHVNEVFGSNCLLSVHRGVNILPGF